MEELNILRDQVAQLQRQVAELMRENLMLREANTSLAKQNKTREHEIQALKKSRTSASDFIDGETKRLDMATVLYASIHGFTKLGQVDNAEHQVAVLDEFYTVFDQIADKYRIKKIKTIGDSLMYAGGVPAKNRSNPIEVIMAALELKHTLSDMQGEDGVWTISFGIHTGPVQVHIVQGTKRVNYELKGDAANIASRIENSVKEDDLIISAMTHEFVHDYFDCEYVGQIPVKYTGDIALYRIEGYKERFQGTLPTLPNFSLITNLQLVRFDDLEEYILNRLENELPKYLHYHNVKHTMDVTIGVEIIGTAEGVTEEEMLLLKSAAVFHDMGQIVQSKGHEEISCTYAKEILPKYGYRPEQIDEICSIIMATKIPPNPQNLLQSIICDADLDYLGRSDFIPVSDTLYHELKTQNLISDIDQWNRLQIGFISNHQYFTEFARNNREVNKQSQIERIKKLLPMES